MLFPSSMQKKWIIGNWKMQAGALLATRLPTEIASFLNGLTVSPHVAIAPSYLWIDSARQALGDEARVLLAGQDCSVHAEGAFTGEVSANMLREIGCSLVIVGHSERRQYHRETDAMVLSKLQRAHEAGLIPIVCVGETLEERESGGHLAVVEAQIKHSILAGGSPQKPFLVAYEPVWAIGTGKTATLADILQMHKHIASVLSCATSGGANAIPVLYGGSVKASNANEILKLDGVDGVLVGGASLKADEFCAIISAAVE